MRERGEEVKVNLLTEDDYVVTCRYSKEQTPVAVSGGCQPRVSDERATP